MQVRAFERYIPLVFFLFSFAEPAISVITTSTPGR